jgi:hypothetical protein
MHTNNKLEALKGSDHLKYRVSELEVYKNTCLHFST